jgi:hypothetical protein
MGRLTTKIAVTGINANNLPAELPEISLWDALLPRRLADPKRCLEKQIRKASIAQVSFGIFERRRVTLHLNLTSLTSLHITSLPKCNSKKASIKHTTIQHRE